MLVEIQAKHLRNLELEREMGAAEVVGRMEEAGAHPLHHSVIGRSSFSTLYAQSSLLPNTFSIIEPPAKVYPHQIFHHSGEAAPPRGCLQGGAGQRDGGQGPPMGGRPCQVLPLA